MSVSRLVRGCRTGIQSFEYLRRTLGLSVMLQAAIYPFRKRYHSLRFGDARGSGDRGSLLRGLSALLPQRKRPGQAPSYAFPGRVLAHRLDEQKLTLTCENATVQIIVLAPDLVRVRARRTLAGSKTPGPDPSLPEPFSYAVAKDDSEWPPVHVTVEESADTLVMRTPRLHCHVNREQLALTFLDPEGTTINADADGIGWETGESERVVCWKRLPPGEHIYGLGQKTTSLEKRGLAFEMWNTDPPNYDPGDDPIYSSIPFYLGLNEERGYGIFFDNSARGRFDFGAQVSDITRFEAECGEMRYYFFSGPRLASVLERYTELTGRAIIPPLWALGYHQNRWTYDSEARVREIARQFRQRRIPCDAIHLDIDHMDGFRSFTWHPQRFPDPGKLISDLHADGFKVVTMADPGIKVDPDYPVYRDGLRKDVFCKYPDGRAFSGPVWPGECHFPDFTSSRVRAWWGELHREMVALGIDGFWNDMNEPSVFGLTGDTFPDVVQHEWEGRGTDHRTAHNVYGMQMARATAEGLMKLRPRERPVVISRSLWAGSQRYHSHWLGDNYSNWPALRNTVQLVMNVGLSGVAFTGPDTGGFIGTPGAELLIRWNQLGAFTPYFRNHTTKGSPDQEPWAFGDTCEQISRQFIELRYRLLPYLYTAVWQAAQTGIPVMRPMVLAFQDDPRTTAIDDQFMFGDAFLVAPIYEPESRSRQVCIPRGTWYDFWDDAAIAGPQTLDAQAPLDRIPLMVRAGSIVPAWPVMQHTGERPVELLTLHVYPGSGESWLYEDDGHTWACREGDYRLTHLACKVDRPVDARQPASIRIQRVVQGPFTPSYRRIQVVLHGVESRPSDLRVDGSPIDASQLVTLSEAGVPRPTWALEVGLFHTIEAQHAGGGREQLPGAPSRARRRLS